MATYTIDSVQDLIDLTLLSGKFAGIIWKDNLFNLTVDLDLTGVDPLEDGKGWKPIGTWASGKWFNGFFDGQGHKISNMTINRPTEDHIGLFGSLDGDADGADPTLNNPIKNLALVDVDITGDHAVGGMIGSSLGNHDDKPIKNCSVTGVIALNMIGGGFVGSSNNGCFKDCWTNVAVTSSLSRTSIGGFIGADSIGTDCINCYSLGAVIAEGDPESRTYIGGFIGEINWEIGDESEGDHCALTAGADGKCLLTQTDHFSTIVVGTPEYARIKFNDEQYDDGLYLILASDDNHSVLVDVDYVGDVADEVEVDCQFVDEFSSCATSSYWDTGTSGNAEDGYSPTADVGFGDAVGKTTEEMKQEATFTDWDFDDIWWITEGSTYPQLRVLEADPALPTKASNESPVDDATDVAINAALSWAKDSGDNVLVYVDKQTEHDPPITLVIDDEEAVEYNPPADLSYNTIYVWRVDTKNENGTTAGDQWEFTTVDLEEEPEEEPETEEVLVKGKGILGSPQITNFQMIGGDDFSDDVCPNGQDCDDKCGLVGVPNEYHPGTKDSIINF